MDKKKHPVYLMAFFVGISLAIKLYMIFKYGNLLTLDSDDLNYVKSAMVLIKRHMLIYYNFNEPTTYIMPLYPAFLAMIFKVFGYGLTGLQAARVAQALISCAGIILIFLIAKRIFDIKVALVAAFLVAFYIPNIVTTGYLLTETLFATLLYLLIYFSLEFSDSPTLIKFSVLGFLWAFATLLRPTIAFYPVMLFFYLFIYKKIGIKQAIKLGVAMALVFVVVMLPWWIRNYQYHGESIPLTASSGNPMLQGTYVNYQQSPGTTVYFRLGKTTFETNKIETEVAKQRIKDEFKKDFWGYLRWFTIGKTAYLWGTVFYWKEFLGISANAVVAMHYILLLGFLGFIPLMLKNFKKCSLILAILGYFNVVHCIYMAFDRYAFPLMPLVSIFCAAFMVSIWNYSSRQLKT